jgi:prepilin-type N-terminal cleavage/methylation domain-containing protein
MLDILKHVRTTRAVERSNDQGFTMIEVIVALMVFAVGSANSANGTLTP